MATSNITPQDVEKKLNLGDVHSAPLKLGSQIVRRSLRVYKGLYDFSILGGAISTIQLIDPVLTDGSQPKLLGTSSPQRLVLPPSFIIARVLIDVITAPTGSGASIALGSGIAAATTDIKGATAVGSFTGLLDGIPVNTAATSLKIPVATVLPGLYATMTISGGVLTAGKFNVHYEGYLSD